jgi:hypothetical protein
MGKEDNRFMNTGDRSPTVDRADLPDDDVKAELSRRVQNVPNETLIPSDKAFEELQCRAKERNRPKPA